MENNITEVVFILDRSGSMGGLEEDTIGGFNSMLAKQRKLPGTAFVTTVLFDNEIITLHDRLPISEVADITEKDYYVRGSTALLDAVGETVERIASIHKYARPEDVPEKTIFIITTDGMENASVRFTYERLRSLVEEKKKNGWEFIFMGANIDAV
ncbi:MAG: VWA domain-containing protein, partial [Clostridia bacterium]|nr:VWA domain-containing protein [Clostridia bacterium]